MNHQAAPLGLPPFTVKFTCVHASGWVAPFVAWRRAPQHQVSWDSYLEYGVVSMGIPCHILNYICFVTFTSRVLLHWVLQVMFPSVRSFIVLVFTVSLHVSAYMVIFRCVGYFIFICLKDSASLLKQPRSLAFSFL
jgi:hypothetical protein